MRLVKTDTAVSGKISSDTWASVWLSVTLVTVTGGAERCRAALARGLRLWTAQRAREAWSEPPVGCW